MPTNIEPIVSAIVLLVESTTFRPFSVSELESKLKSVVEVGDRVIAPDGTILTFIIPKTHQEIVISNARWQFALHGVTVNKEVADQSANAIHALAEFAPRASWKGLGYNYNVAFPTPEGRLAIEVIGKSTLDASALTQKLGYKVKGSATWLYMDVDGKSLWLRLEPRGGDINSSLVWVFGNFDRKLDGSLPTKEQIASEFVHLNDVFTALIGKLTNVS